MMATLSTHHRELNEMGEGKCSVPMWRMGMPSGFCNAPAYGEQPRSRMVWNAGVGEYQRADGGYNGYVPALACPIHGGPLIRTLMDGNAWCAVMPDFINLQESPSGWGDTKEEAIASLKKELTA